MGAQPLFYRDFPASAAGNPRGTPPSSDAGCPYRENRRAAGLLRLPDAVAHLADQQVSDAVAVSDARGGVAEFRVDRFVRQPLRVFPGPAPWCLFPALGCRFPRRERQRPADRSPLGFPQEEGGVSHRYGNDLADLPAGVDVTM